MRIKIDLISWKSSFHLCHKSLILIHYKVRFSNFSYLYWIFILILEKKTCIWYRSQKLPFLLGISSNSYKSNEVFLSFLLELISLWNETPILTHKMYEMKWYVHKMIGMMTRCGWQGDKKKTCKVFLQPAMWKRKWKVCWLKNETFAPSKSNISVVKHGGPKGY